MSFVGRARSSFERGDTLRAVLTLVAGLRREPGRDDAMTLLVELVRDSVESGGIEHEIAQVVARQPDADQLLSEMVHGLLERDQGKIADRLRSEGARRDVRYIPPPEPAPQAEAEAESETEPDPRPDSEPEEGPQHRAGGDVEGEEHDAEVEAEGEDELHPEAKDEPAIVDDDTALARRTEALEERARQRRRRRRRRMLLTGTVTTLIGMVVAGLYTYRYATRAGDLARLDESIQRFSTFDPDAFSVVEEAADDRRSAAFSERLQFAAVLAGRRPDQPTSIDASTGWGLSAHSVANANSGDIEEALTAVTKAERLEPGTMPTTYARAYLEEKRGNAVEARRSATRVLDQFPRFVPAHELLIRIAARQLEFERMRAAIARLSRHAPEHPYAGFGTLVDPGTLLLQPEVRGSDAEEVERLDRDDAADPFARAVRSYRDSVAASRRADPAAAAEHASEAVRLEPRLAPARLVLASALAASGRPEESAAMFEDSAALAESGELRTLLQAVAPTALVGAGRAELALRFTTPFQKLRGPGIDDRVDEELADSRPAALRKPALGDVGRLPWADDALFARAEVLRAQGRHGLAVAMLRELDQRGIDPARARARAAAISLSTGEEMGWEPTLADETGRRLVAMTEDWRSGRFAAVAATPDVDLPRWSTPWVVRMRVSSMLRLRRVADAVDLLDRAELGLAHLAGVRGLRLRALAALGRENRPFVELYEQLSTVEPNATDRLLDLGEAALLQRNFAEVDRWLNDLEKIAPLHRDAAWLCGLASRARNRDEVAERCFERSGRNIDATAGLLVELGYVQLEGGRAESARKSFQQALRLEGVEVDAARGLGEAYARHGDRSVAARALGSLRNEYTAEEGLDAEVRGELTKWLAVVQGVREGTEEGRATLEAAAALLGERDDVLLERARHHHAREEYDAARALYESALETNATLAAAHLEIGRIDLRGGERETAREHLKRYLELEPRGRSAEWARRQLKAK